VVGNLPDLRLGISGCVACPLHEGRTNAVPGDGPTDAEVVFIGEAPGFYEDKQARPFVGQAGKFLDELLERYHHCAFSISRHPDRDCLYEEARACIALGKDNADVINSQVYGYRLDGFPKRAGLVASGVIIRSSPHITFENAWWEEVRLKSCRDQLSFPVIARSTGLDYQVMPFEELMKNFFLWHDDHPKPIATPPTSVSDPASH